MIHATPRTGTRYGRATRQIAVGPSGIGLGLQHDGPPSSGSGAAREKGNGGKA